MSPGSDATSGDGVLGVARRAAPGGHLVVSLVVGVTAGASLSLLFQDAVALPFVGPLPGPVVGGAGLLGALATYRTVTGRTDGCGCSGECGCD